MTSDDFFLFCPLVCHDRQPNEQKRKGSSAAIKRRRTDNPNRQKRKGSSEAIKRRRADNPMEKRERGHQRS
jgi:hypothetical protein